MGQDGIRNAMNTKQQQRAGILILALSCATALALVLNFQDSAPFSWFFWFMKIFADLGQGALDISGLIGLVVALPCMVINTVLWFIMVMSTTVVISLVPYCLLDYMLRKKQD